MALATKMITGSVQAGTLSCSMLTTNSGPPMALVTLLSTHARSRVMNTLAILSRPRHVIHADFLEGLDLENHHQDDVGCRAEYESCNQRASQLVAIDGFKRKPLRAEHEAEGADHHQQRNDRPSACCFPALRQCRF